MEKASDSTPDKPERTLSASAMDLDSLIANVPGAIYRCAADREWTMAFMSEGIKAITGRPASDFLGEGARTYFSIIHPDDRTKDIEALNARIAAGDSPRSQYRIIHADGSVRWVSEHVQAVRNEAGEITWIDGTIRDITEPMAAEEKFAGLLGIAPSPTLIVDSQGLIVSANAQTENLLGYEPDELIGKPIEMLVPERYRPGHEDHRARYVEAPEIRAMGSGRELSALRKDGSAVPVEISLGPFGAEGGDFVIASMRDITKRVRAQEALGERERQLTEAARIAHLGHYIWDEVATRMIFVSEEYARIFGLSVEECLARYKSAEDDIAAIHPDDQARFKTVVYDQVTPDTPSYSLDYRILRPDGEIRHVHETSETTFDAHGTMLRTAGTIQDITERVEAEQALRENERLLTIAQQTARIGHWVWRTKDGKRNNVSAEWLKIWGFADEEEFEGLESMHARIHPDDVERALEISRSIHTAPHDYTIDFRILHPDGEVIDAFEQGIVNYDSDSNAIGMTGITQDITERVRAEKKLRASEEDFRTLAKNMPGAFYRTSLQDGTVLFMSEGIETLTGRSNLDFIGTPIQVGWSFVYDEDRPVVENALRSSLESGQSFVIEYRIWHSDGSIRWLSELGQPVSELESGNLVWLDGFIIDITERKLAEEALHERELQLSEATRIARLGHYIWDDAEGRLVFCSEEYARIHGLSVTECLARYASMEDDIADVRPDDQARYKAAAYDQLTPDAPSSSIDYRIIHPDGEVRHVHESSETTFDAHGNMLRSVGTIQDITEHKIAEQTLRESEEEFRAMVANVPGAVYRSKPTGNWPMTFISSGLEKITGYPRPTLSTTPYAPI